MKRNDYKDAADDDDDGDYFQWLFKFSLFVYWATGEKTSPFSLRESPQIVL